MKLTTRQNALLMTALTVFYDEIVKTTTSELKTEVMELARRIQQNTYEGRGKQ